MELYSPENADRLGIFAEQLNRSPQINLPKTIRQTQSLSLDDLNSILGTNEEFLSRYKSFEERVFSMMEDTRYLSFGAKPGDIQAMRNMGNLDLSVFNYEARNNLRQMFNDNVLRLDELMSRARNTWNRISFI